MFQAEVEQEIKTHILCTVTCFENHAVYEIKRKNIVERGRPQMAIWRMRIACWITKTKHTLKLCNTYSFSTAAMVARSCLHIKCIRTVHGLSSYNLGQCV
jgi:hypothetical protein